MQLGFVSASSGFRFVMEESPVLCISLSSRYGTLLFSFFRTPSKLGAEKTDVPVACAMLNCYYYLTTLENRSFFFF